MFQTQVKVWWFFEVCISSVINLQREGRRGGPKDFHRWSWNWEWYGTDEKDIEELEGMCGPLCWQGYDKNFGGFLKLMWYGIMKEFNFYHIHVVRVVKGTRNERFSRTNIWAQKKEKISQLDHTIGPKWRNNEVYIHDDVRTWVT